MRAANENRRPPLTTLATRLTRMVRSSYCVSVIVSELQSLFTGGVGQNGDPAVIGEAAPIEDHPGNPGGLGPGRPQATDGFGSAPVTPTGRAQLPALLSLAR